MRRGQHTRPLGPPALARACGEELRLTGAEKLSKITKEARITAEQPPCFTEPLRPRAALPKHVPK